MTGFPAIRTADGSVIVHDPTTGLAVSGRSLVEALAELRRLLASHTHARGAPDAREGEAA